jgi:hypothetical protein
LRIVDSTREQLLLGCLGQHAEDRKTDQESVGRGYSPEPERDFKRVVLGLGQALGELRERRAQLLDRRVRELHFRLDSDGPCDPKLGCGLDGVLEQRGLADAWFAMHDQGAGTSGANSVEQPVEDSALGFPAEQRSSRSEDRWRGSAHSFEGCLRRVNN